MLIVNDDPGIINKLGASLTDYARVVIYDHHMFIVQATGHFKFLHFASEGTYSYHLIFFNL
jgi:hypothetical protein